MGIEVIEGVKVGGKAMKVIAAIDIGSHAMKIKIVEVYEGNKMRTLEDIKSEVVLGIDTFRNQKIANSSIVEGIKTLDYFSRLMKDYGVTDYRAVATEAIRRAQNGQYVIDQLSKKCGLIIEILEEPIERHLTYLSLKTSLQDYKLLRKKGLLLVEVGSGSTEITIYKNDKLIRNNEVRVGTLQLKEIMRTFEGLTLHKPNVLEDFVYANTENLQKYLIRKEIHHFAIVGGHVKEIAKLFASSNGQFERKQFDKFYQLLFTQDYGLYQKLTANQMDMDEVLAAFIIFNQFLNHTDCESISVPEISLRDGLLIYMNETDGQKTKTTKFVEDILSATRGTAKRYYSNMPHVKRIEEHAVAIFKVLKPLEGLRDEDLLVLRISIALHEIGKFIKQSEYYYATYQNIKNASILGLSTKVLESAAKTSLASFWMSGEAPETTPQLEDIKKDIYLLKLGAIQALSDALDKSKKQRLSIHSVKLEQDILIIGVRATEEFLYEKWMVSQLKGIYSDLFGYEIKIVEV